MEPTMSRSGSSQNLESPSLMDIIERSPMAPRRSGFLGWWYRAS
jgi:hypothetical protein